MRDKLGAEGGNALMSTFENVLGDSAVMSGKLSL